MPRQRQMSLMKNFNATHHSQATSKSKRIWNIHFPIYCSGTPTWLCARVEPAQNRYSTRSPTPCRRLLMFASSYFWPPPSSYSKCAWKVFYDILNLLVLFIWRKTVGCELSNMNNVSGCFVTTQVSKTRKTKTTCGENGDRENSKLDFWLSIYSVAERSKCTMNI